MREFDTEVCNVRYIEEDNVVLLTWKRFACGDDYRRPTTFAWELLKEKAGSRFVVDARNGFEDEKEDAEWGFSVLLPGMAQTTCKMVCFIMNEVNEIEEEMDMWTKEFGRYFAVAKATDYKNALERINRLLLVNARYHIRSGKREEFYSKIEEQGIMKASRGEPGNYKYDYYLPKNSYDDLCLMEIWTNEQTQKLHGLTEHYQKLTALKQEYVETVEIQKYWITEA
ncbi:putative quinol monooxygenase [Anaerocolumna xylanovorans]|uniref:Quinol monooxygenase YgiN n=1 Tax=Anaerocolumna xylanovorans DSM 12503 TaxID=1121345 RepID=A0A1M7Y5I6_9FIRM|nr:antibiotic biosynthesis monooxygenase [Anaerocolumna xylanovorans]SHO47677.1 Quinol monooxygenase YgiN [Anaerocolumna xylanovorans DSM 12503]